MNYRNLCLALLLITTGPVVAQSQEQVFELLNRIQLLEQEIRELRGDMEVMQYQLQQSQGQQGEVPASLLQRLEALEQQAGLDPNTQPLSPDTNTEVADQNLATMTPPADTTTAEPTISQPQPDPPPAPVVNTSPPSAAEEEAYQMAFAHLREGQYDEAASRFQDFLNRYPSSSLAGNAQYWLGEVYYVTRNFDAAQRTFLSLGSNYPNSDKLPDTMLKLGYIYEEQGNPERAREVYGMLLNTYPDSRSATLGQRRLEALP